MKLYPFHVLTHEDLIRIFIVSDPSITDEGSFVYTGHDGEDRKVCVKFSHEKITDTDNAARHITGCRE